MNNKPLLIFPRPASNPIIKRGGFPPKKPHFPSYERQTERLGPKFDTLQSAFEQRRVELLNDPSGASPEKILVLETIGSIRNFINAVNRIHGMEWMGEWTEEDIPADEDFYDEKQRDKPLWGYLYLILTMLNYRFTPVFNLLF